MRILYVVDVYPPARTGGATLYVVKLAETLATLGAKVSVMCAGTWEEGTRHLNRVVVDRVNGVEVFRINLNWRAAAIPFDSLYDNSALVPVFRRILQQLQPDIVHVHSCLTLSARIIPECRRLGLPVILHLHDFWFLCARQNLVRKSGEICEGPESVWGCQQCLLEGTKVLTAAELLLPRGLQPRVIGLAGTFRFLTRQKGLRGMLGNMSRRHEYLRAVFSQVDATITPARHAIERFRQYGFVTNNMRYLPLGIDTSWCDKVSHSPSADLRFAYIGHIQSIKGLDTLVKAFATMPDDVQLAIYGDMRQEPEYVSALVAQSASNTIWKGAFQHDDLPEVLSRIDVVVVPSLCHEFSPTVIHEAYAASIPVIVSDTSGPAELVHHDVDGLVFRRGDVAGLANALMRFQRDRDLQSRLKRGIRPVTSIASNVEELLGLYRSLHHE